MVNAGTTYQMITGFGAASAWNTIDTTEAKVLWTDDSAALVSNTGAHVNGDVGLSLLRTRIDPTGAFAQEEANITLVAKNYPGVKVWSTEWSPPAAYKNNNNVDGNAANNTFNNTAANSTAYANYLVNYVNNVKTTCGATLYALSPQNEPDYNTTYESCLWTAAQFDDFVKTYLGPAFKTAGLSTKIMVTESFQDSLALAATTMDDAAAAPFVGILAGHLYGDLTSSNYTGTFINAKPASSAGFTHFTNQDYWETEMSDVTGAGVDNTMQSALEEAYWIHTCIVDWGMNAFHHWWINATDNSGLVSGTDVYSDKLYVLGNFSKFIRPGFTRIAATESPATGVSCSAYDTSARVVVVAINKNTSTVSQTFSITGLNVSSVVPWITDSADALVQQAAVTVSGGLFTFTLPAQSVVTFVGDCASGSTPTDTVTASVTPSRTATKTTTPSVTVTATFSRTSSASPSATESSTPTAAWTRSRTVSPSATVTYSITVDSSPTSTLTVSPTDLSTHSVTRSPSPTTSATASHTSSPVSAPTFSATVTVSPPFTSSASPTQTVSLSPSLTGTVSAPATSTAVSSPTRTLTVTVTLSSSPSAGPTATVTETGTLVPIFSFSPSATVTPSESPVRTSTVTSIATHTTTAAASPHTTATGSPTAASSPVPPTRTAAATVSVGGVLKIDQAVPVPNPNPVSIGIDLAGAADGVEGTLYSLAEVEVGHFSWAAQAVGWDRLPLSLRDLRLPRGLYYLRLRARRGSALSAAVPVKLVLLNSP